MPVTPCADGCAALVPLTTPRLRGAGAHGADDRTALAP